MTLANRIPGLLFSCLIATVSLVTSAAARVEPDAIQIGGASNVASDAILRDGSSVPARLANARHGHSLAMAPDGRILVYGGRSATGEILASNEWVDPGTWAVESADNIELIPRTDHQVLPRADGTILVLGGVAEGVADIRGIELFDLRSGRSRLLEMRLPVRTRGALWFGDQGEAVHLVGSGWAEPLKLDLPSLAPALRSVWMAELYPSAGAQEIPVESVPGVRWRSGKAADAVRNLEVTLLGPHGHEQVDVRSFGDISFMRPARELYPASRYTLIVQVGTGEFRERQIHHFTTESIHADRMDPRIAQADGQSAEQASAVSALDGLDQSVPRGATQVGAEAREQILRQSVRTAYTFAVTKSRDPDVFEPDASNLFNNWQTPKHLPAAVQDHWNLSTSVNTFAKAVREKRVRDTGPTRVKGMVLSISDRPLANVPVEMAGQRVKTDTFGRYEFRGVPGGAQPIVIDGSALKQGNGDEFAQFVVNSRVRPQGDSFVEPVYLPKVRQSDWIAIDSPLKADLTIDNPTIPGFRIHLPKGTVLRDRTGKIVRRVATIPVPLDRAPLNYPTVTPVHMTFQPAGLSIEGLAPGRTRGIRFTYPNYSAEAPGTVAQFLNYDPFDRGWFSYGTGRVTTDGLRVEPDAGTEFFQATGFGISFGPSPPATPRQSCGAEGGDPVDLRTGLFLHHTQGPILEDRMPVEFGTTYRPMDTVERELGKGTFHNYSHYLHKVGTANGHLQWDEFTLVLPDCSQVKFNRTSPAAPYYPVPGFKAVAENKPGAFLGAELTWDSSEYNKFLVTRRDGTKLVFETTQGRLREIRNKLGDRVEIQRRAGIMSRIVSPSGRALDVTSSATRINQVRDGIGRIWTYQYDASGRLERMHFPDSSFERYVYDAQGRMEEVFDRRGNRMVKNTFDASNRVIHQLLADNSTYVFRYTGPGHTATAVEIDEPGGATRRVTFHASGYPATETEALGTPLERTTTFDRNAGGFLTAVTDPLGRQVTLTYDAEFRLDRVTDVLRSRFVDYDYSASHDVVRIEDERGRAKTIVYQAQRLPVTIHDEYLDRTTTLEYNDLDNLFRITDPDNRQLTIDYELFDPIRATTDTGASVSRFVDSLGRTTAFTDQLGVTTRLKYDELDRVNEVLGPDGARTFADYDPMGNMLVLTDAVSSSTHWTYDVMQRPLTETDALQKVSSWSYDVDLRLVRATDRTGRVHEQRFDLLGRPDTVRIDVHGTNDLIDYAFDGVDRLSSIADASGLISLAYDLRDNLLSETTSQGTIGYGYDLRDRLTSRFGAGLPTASYVYDDLDRLREIHEDPLGPVRIDFDTQHRMSQVTLPNGIQGIPSYDPNNRINAVTYRKANGNLVGDLQYDHDAAGQLTRRSGTLLQSKLDPASASPDTVDANHRLTTRSGTNFTYDDRGNLLNDGQYDYRYDSRDRLIEVAVGPSTIAQYAYDVLDRRISTSILPQGGTQPRQIGYRYDGGNVLQEQENTQTRNLLNGFGLDTRFGRDNKEGGRDYFLTDNIGSVVALTGQTGDINARYAYSAYGATDFQPIGNFQTDNPYQYTNRENDGRGLYYYRARYYSPSLKRFTQEDPLGFADGPNPYAYVGGNPLQYSDPTGLYAWDPMTVMFWPAKGVADGIIEAGWTNEIVGWADGYLAWGVLDGQAIRGMLGISGGVDPCSDGYRIAYGLGMATAAAMPSGMLLGSLRVGKAAKGALDGANYAQKTFGSKFSKGGVFAGKSVDDVAAALRSGAMKPSEVPIDFIVRDGNTLILNTRSAQALEAAGIRRSQWKAVNRTGQEMYEDMLSGQLQRNGLTSKGIANVRRSGGF